MPLPVLQRDRQHLLCRRDVVAQPEIGDFEKSECLGDVLGRRPVCEAAAHGTALLTVERCSARRQTGRSFKPAIGVRIALRTPKLITRVSERSPSSRASVSVSPRLRFVIRSSLESAPVKQVLWDVHLGSHSMTKVLIVDDLVDYTRCAATIFRRWGYEVQVANSGPEAFDACRRDKPDVILLDIGMPGVTGYEVTIQLREVFAAREISPSVVSTCEVMQGLPCVTSGSA